MSNSIKVRAEDGTPINQLVELLFLEHSQLVESAEKFEISTGASSLTSSGEPRQLSFTVKFPKSNSQTIDNITTLQAVVRDFEDTEGIKIIIEEVPHDEDE
ncbi:MAG: hypothetical protein AAFQ24_13995 [Pseudomonadota bacterium]